MAKRIVVVGGGYAGVMAAVRAARRVRDVAEVVLVAPSAAFVERVRLHERACDDRRAHPSIPELLAPSGARFVEACVDAIDPDGRTLQAGGRTIAWDKLVVATGSRTAIDRVPGVRAHAFTLDGGSAERLAAALPAIAARGGRLAVVGGGLTAIEAAAELAERWPALRVALFAGGSLEPALSSRAKSHVRRVLARLGVELHDRGRVGRVGAGVLETDRGEEAIDACVFAGGFVANELVARAGLTVNERGQALVDARLRALDHPDVYVVGDAAALVADLAPTVGPIAMSCKLALPMGAHAADDATSALLGRAVAPFRFGDTGVCVSLGRRDGVVDLRRTDGTPRDFVLTGVLGAWVKEAIVRTSIGMLRLESQGRFRYRWLRPSVRELALGRADRGLPA